MTSGSRMTLMIFISAPHLSQMTHDLGDLDGLSGEMLAAAGRLAGEST